MKAIQISFDERLLGRLDRDELVRRKGRSFVFRRAIEEYLERARSQKISEAYVKGYENDDPTELSGWEDQGEWPEK